MLDDAYTFGSVIVVSFVEEANANEARVHVKGLDARGAIGVRDAAVVVWEGDCKIEQGINSARTARRRPRAAGSSVFWSRSSVDRRACSCAERAGYWLVHCLTTPPRPNRCSAIISKSIEVASGGLLADVSEAAIDAVMAHLGGTRSAANVKLEIITAEAAHHGAKEKAENELREARRTKRKEEVDGKIAELKARLHGRKKPAGARS